MPIGEDVQTYNAAQTPEDRALCELLAREFETGLPGAVHKVWHRHPVWFLEGNPIVGYVRQKAGMHVLFWSGQSFDEPGLTASGSFKAAGLDLASEQDLDLEALRRSLEKARAIQWDYKNLAKRKGKLERLK